MGTYPCKGCVAPKRYPGCHATCLEYLTYKAEYEKRKAIADRERDINVGIIISRRDKVYKAMKDRRKMKT